MARRAALVGLVALVLASGCAWRTPKANPAAEVRMTREDALRESSGLVLVHVDSERHAIVADEDDASLSEVVITNGPEATHVAATTKLGTRPRDLLVLPEGRLAVTLPDVGAVAIFARDAKGTLHEAARLHTPTEPLAMALSPDDKTLWVTSGAGHAVVAFDVATRLETSRVDLGREPRALLVADDGERVFVTHASETFVSAVDTKAPHAVERIDIGDHNACGDAERGFGMPCGQRRFARNAHAIVRAKDGLVVIPTAQSLPQPIQQPIFVASKEGFFEGTSKPSRGMRGGGGGGYGFGGFRSPPAVVATLVGIDTQYRSVLPAAEARRAPPTDAAPLGTERHDGGCLLPRAAVRWSGEDPSHSLVIACEGSGELVRVGVRKTDDDDEYGPSETPVDVDRLDLSAREHLERTVIPVPEGPTAMAATRGGERIFVWSAFRRVVSVVDVAAKVPGVVASIEIPRVVPRDADWLAGRALFHATDDRRISVDGRACATCHVDGRDDGLVWSTPSGPRRTRLLAGQLTSAPFGWNGDHPTLEAHVTTTMKNLRGQGLGDPEMKSLLTYVRSMAFEGSHPAGRPASDVARGRELFASADCASCHTTKEGDRATHDVGTGGTFLTPSLAGVGGRGRLMHDGRYQSLPELLASAKRMGHASTLPDADRAALARYLETL